MNAWSSLAFVGVGVLLIMGGTTRQARLAGITAALIGVGSTLFHGRIDGFSAWLHDWSIVAFLLVVVSGPALRLQLAVALAAGGAVIAVLPDAGE